MKQALHIQISAAVFVILFISFVPVGLCEGEGARIQRELDLNFSVDVPVISGVSGEISTILVEPAMIDTNAFEKALATGLIMTSKEKYESGSDAYGTRYYAEYEGDISLSTDNMTANFSTPMSNIIGQAVSAFYILNDDFLNAPDLSFMPRSQVENEVDALLSSIGIDNAQCHAIYAFDAERMEELSKKYSELEAFKHDLENGEFAAYKEKWSREDDCYWLRYRLVVSGMPLYPRPYDILGFDAYGWFMGSFIDILVTQEGVIGFSGRGLMRGVSEDVAEAIMPQEAAVDQLKKKFENVLFSEQTTVKEMGLYYIAEPDSRKKDALRLIPTWCYGEIDHGYNDISILDARDGRVIQ